MLFGFLGHRSNSSIKTDVRVTESSPYVSINLYEYVRLCMSVKMISAHISMSVLVRNPCLFFFGGGGGGGSTPGLSVSTPLLVSNVLGKRCDNS